MNLVDLAGSENISLNPNSDRQKEALAINKHLNALGDVISAFSQGFSHVPFRNSKLTQLLERQFNKDSKILMIVNVSPLKTSF